MSDLAIELIIQTAKTALQLLTEATPLQRQIEFLEWVKGNDDEWLFYNSPEPIPNYIEMFKDMAQLQLITFENFDTEPNKDINNKYCTIEFIINMGCDYERVFKVFDDEVAYYNKLLVFAAGTALETIEKRCAIQQEIERYKQEYNQYSKSLQSFLEPKGPIITEKTENQQQQSVTINTLNKQSPETNELLSNDVFMSIMQRAFDCRFAKCEYGKYIWLGLISELAYFAQLVSDKLKLCNRQNDKGDYQTSWQPFEQLFCTKDGNSIEKGKLRLIASDWKNKSGNLPKRHKDIEQLID